MGKQKNDDDEPQPQPCGDCNGEGGSWALVDPVAPTKNGKRNRGQQKWIACGRCNGTGLV